MSKEQDAKNDKAHGAAATQSTAKGYVSSGFEKRREFRAYINGNNALRERVVSSAIRRVEERNRARVTKG